ncbi:MAG: hypothetical protein O2829_03175 [Bacteroidetes bacterium]|nr:hypothetical protein [Bacteroidota bacterium]MDA1268074.1 hypothetical protein [Bacteroidota bacterium]
MMRGKLELGSLEYIFDNGAISFGVVAEKNSQPNWPRLYYHLQTLLKGKAVDKFKVRGFL